MFNNLHLYVKTDLEGGVIVICKLGWLNMYKNGPKVKLIKMTLCELITSTHLSLSNIVEKAIRLILTQPL